MPVATRLPRAAWVRRSRRCAPASVAGAAPAKPSPSDRAPFTTDTGDVFSGGAHQHRSDEGHLPGSSANVNIFDITNPRAPKPVAEYDLLEDFPQISQTAEHPRLTEIFNHDMVTKVIDGRDVLLDSYWDGGYVMLDVENPAKATYVGDTDFENEDPLVEGISPPEGNAHQAEFSHDSTYFLGADEDFNPYRSDKFFVDDQERPAVEVGGGTSPAALPDQTLSGKVVYGGYGCPADPTTTARGSDRRRLLSRREGCEGIRRRMGRDRPGRPSLRQ